ncbi:hypothetical protein OHAE_949 [Ochrobactrum soli]|uniref:Uncharacterized protein n=1 Tax=Ochrobactrum soli TaxID=2448455 RepID=A0A2P9HLV1_9HYPH|nr:hypothetical protein OHAE_949 [[Ochrobactrum] soli]
MDRMGALAFLPPDEAFEMVRKRTLLIMPLILFAVVSGKAS